MVDINCEICGEVMRYTDSTECRGDITLVFECTSCGQKIKELEEERDNLSETVDHYMNMIEEYDKDVDAYEKQIADLKDFIDGYIDDREV